MLLEENSEIKPIKVVLDDCDNNNLKLYVLADTHLGDPNCNIEEVKKIVNFIKDTPQCYCVLLGDILNTALKTSKSDIYSETMNVAQAQQLALELFEPIKHKILAITPGNHENRVWRETGIDMYLWFAKILGLEDYYRNNGIALSLKFGKDVNGNAFRLNIFGQHGGYGGGRRMGAPINALEDMDGIVSNADIYVRAHTHQQVQGSRCIYQFNDLGNMVRKTKYYFNAPSILTYGGYAYDKGYRPTDNSPCYLNIRAVSTKKENKIYKNYKIDKVML